MIGVECLHVVCVAVGDLEGRDQLYLDRFHGMLQRHIRRPFDLTCVTDQPRKLPSSVRQIDCSDWDELRRKGGRPTRIKLGLFNPDYIAFGSFLYLDLSLVIRRNMEALLDFVDSRPEDLVIIRDWNYDVFNSSVMRIRNRSMQFIYEEFVSGIEYPYKVAGDQDFITSSCKNRGVHPALFPEDMIVSFKHVMREGKSDPAASAARVKGATIVKFHGKPKMHQVFNPLYRFFKYGIRYLRRGQFHYPFSIRELEDHWRSGEREPT